MNFLETERLCLRNLRPEDAEILFEYRNHPLCAQYQRGQTRDLPGIRSLIERRSQDRLSPEAAALLGIARKEDGELIGEVVIMPDRDVITLGYTLSWRYHRRGYAFELLQEVISRLHRERPDLGFLCYTEPENLPSIGLLKKLGFRELGYSVQQASRVFALFLPEALEQAYQAELTAPGS